MILGTVKGTITSTINHPFYTGKKLLVVEKEDFAGKPGGYLIAIDGGLVRDLGKCEGRLSPSEQRQILGFTV